MASRSICSKDTTYRYVLRLLAVDTAIAFEEHLQKCDKCAERAYQLTDFLRLIRKSLRNRESIDSSTRATMEAFLHSSAESVKPHDEEKLIQALANCFSGYERLYRNLLRKVENADADKIKQIAVEIMLALPAHLHNPKKG